MYAVPDNDTIVAIATPPGKSAIGVVRLSGEKAIELANNIFQPKNLLEARPNTIHFGKILDENKDIVDEVLISIFKTPHSYTGEDLVEISCHGSMFILNEVVKLLVRQGARMAKAGEFTLRAFLNKKIDLSQAEAVADIIDSESKAAHDIAFRQMRGGYSHKLEEIRNQILEIVSLFELELDFAEEDVEFASNEQLLTILDKLDQDVSAMVSSFSLGNALKKGVSVVISGRPNAGKSTLLNTLLQEERAIISDIPGTTRDYIEDSIQIKGVQFRFIDTAGITETTNEIEQIGIQKTREVLERTDLIIYLFDLVWLDIAEVEEDLASLNTNAKILVVANKTDKIPEEELNARLDSFSAMSYPFMALSCRQGEGIEKLKQSLYNSLDIENYSGEATLVSNQRHYEVLHRIEEEIQSVKKAIGEGITKDLVSTSLKTIIHYLGEITGEITNDEILGNIFGRFCIGK